MIQTRLTEFLQITHPIIQAPMALAAGGKLAAAVAEAGGLGLIGGGYGDGDWLTREFLATGNVAVGCGFITWSMAKDAGVLELALSHEPKAMMLSFGDVRPFADKIKDAGAVFIAQIQTLEQAVAAIDSGADIIVAQGAEAGGHGLHRGTVTLVPETADLIAKTAPQTLLCAAGGIADGRGLVAALALGADGVLIGSRLWASSEALVHPHMHEAAVAANGDETIRSRVMDMARQRAWPQDYTARVLKNAFTERWHGREDDLEEALERVIPEYQNAWETGDVAYANVFIGEAAGLIKSVMPAASIIENIVAEAGVLIKKQQGLVV